MPRSRFSDNLLSDAQRPAFWGAVGIAVALAARGTLPTAGGFLAGALWNIANLWLLQALALAWGREQRRRALTLLLIKLLVLYPVGLMLALSKTLSLVAILAGFSWPFAVLIACAVRSGRAGRPSLAAESPRG